jgi:hypothetical protein
MNKIEDLKKIPQPDELSTIEKLIWCLNDYYFETFVKILQEQNAKLSVKLIYCIRNQAEKGKWGNLSKLIYGENTLKCKQSLNQLCSYTFKLTYYLAQNHPEYLLSNLHDLQQWINEGKMEAANFLMEILLDIAEKIEDYTVLKFVYQVKQQQAYLVKDATKGNRYQLLLKGVLEDEALLHQIHFIQRFHFNINSEKTPSAEEIEKYTSFIRQQINHPRAGIRIFSMYALLYIKYYFQPKLFSSEKTMKEVEMFEKELNFHSYVVFPPLLDLRSSMNFLKLNSSLVNLETNDGQKEFKQMQQHYNRVQFWKTYINVPELYMLTVKTTFYLSKYTHLIHLGKPALSVREAEEIELLKNRCKEVLSMPVLNEKGHSSDKLYTSITFAALLLLGNPKEVKQSVEMIEELLFSYQQLNINASLDSVFLCLMIGYFALKDYGLCAKTFVRYSKLAKGKPLHEDNDLSIHILYYTAQWLTTQRKQYLAKLQRCYDIAFQHDFYRDSRKLLNAFSYTYKLRFQSDFFVTP